MTQVEDFRQSVDSNSFQNLYHSDEIDAVLSAYIKYCDIDEGPMKYFWNSYIEMVGLLLTFIRATREGNWELHLSCIREFLPWFFAYDRHNYSRYLPVYLLHMQNIPDTHPQTHTYLSSGGFCVQRGNHSFSRLPVDQTIEQTLNRDTKTKGGLVGFSINKAAVERWMLNAHERAAMSQKCRELAGLNDGNNIFSKEMGTSRKERDEGDVRKIKDTLQC